MNPLFFTVTFKNFTSCHQQPYTSIITFIFQPVHLQHKIIAQLILFIRLLTIYLL
ncbi:hypothetical protein Hanom_Chr17g01554691 [Helianthus anomalus]